MVHLPSAHSIYPVRMKAPRRRLNQSMNQSIVMQSSGPALASSSSLDLRFPLFAVRYDCFIKLVSCEPPVALEVLVPWRLPLDTPEQRF